MLFFNLGLYWLDKDNEAKAMPLSDGWRYWMVLINVLATHQASVAWHQYIKKNTDFARFIQGRFQRIVQERECALVAFKSGKLIKYGCGCPLISRFHGLIINLNRLEYNSHLCGCSSMVKFK